MGSMVTTKRGDGGESTTMSGDRYPKSHPIFRACGDVDSVRARTAALRLTVLESGRDDAQEMGEKLLWLLHVYFLIGSHCNDPEDKHPEYRNRNLSEVELERLEVWQAALEERTPLQKVFIVGASNRLAADTDILCTDVRRLERSVVELKEAVPAFDAEVVLKFINRLSDTLFVLARSFEDGKHLPVEYGTLD